MDVMSGANVFAMLVGLLCNFRQEKATQKALSHQDFIDWLGYHHHEELKQLITGTAAIQSEVDQLLRREHAEMSKRFDQANGLLTALISRLDPFRNLALAVAPNVGISEQSLSILRQCARSADNELIFQRLDSTSCIFMLPHVDVLIEYTEPRFLEDDLNRLVELGLLSLVPGYSNVSRFGITRAGVQLIETIDRSTAEEHSNP